MAVSSMGLVTSVGRSAQAACAAIRAGISRPRRCSYYTSLDSETQDTLPITSHPIRAYTEGFGGAGLWMRLARGALTDLLGDPGLPPTSDVGFWRRTGLLAVTASPEGERFQMEEGGQRSLEEAFLHPLLERLALPLERQHSRLSGVDHAGTALALQGAWRLLSQGACERVLLVAVDSYLDPLTLQWLDGAERLKAGDVPSGLSPGEAGVCLLLEKEDSARRRGAAPLAFVTAVATGREPHSYLRGEVSTGAGLARCVREALETAGLPQPYEGDVFSDLSGETWRAQEWGSAVVRLSEQLGSPRLHLPCVSVGDVGAASGALGLCLATHTLQRGHTRQGSALVLSSSVEGDVGCMVLSNASSRPPER
ncbi:hypothetical protein D7V93_22715 [Corallococcus llansteffanensis]|uniref:Beta-ketoacyl synthase N-terminal domain-containing protein n=1 Tax=Corallococcus llansteffanensis TaxID=2316731 RepID=A0A3A8PGN6_9BACT|nr:hypothetical protein D7V93_22715 [Corallococcus llansteffanensis]